MHGCKSNRSVISPLGRGRNRSAISGEGHLRMELHLRRCNACAPGKAESLPVIQRPLNAPCNCSAESPRDPCCARVPLYV